MLSKAGHEYEIVSMGASFGNTPLQANSDAAAILAATGITGGTIAKGDKFTVDKNANS